MLKVGDNAPDFELKNQDGELRSLKNYKDKTLILYFYPRDDTPGCTKEACSLTKDISALNKKGFAVVGISKDSVESHRKFKSKYKIAFDLLSDEDKKTIKDYKVWIKKKLYGREFMGVARNTFIIEKGKIKKIFMEVDTANHSNQILKG